MGPFNLGLVAPEDLASPCVDDLCSPKPSVEPNWSLRALRRPASSYAWWDRGLGMIWKSMVNVNAHQWQCWLLCKGYPKMRLICWAACGYDGADDVCIFFGGYRNINELWFHTWVLQIPLPKNRMGFDICTGRYKYQHLQTQRLIMIDTPWIQSIKP